MAYTSGGGYVFLTRSGENRLLNYRTKGVLDYFTNGLGLLSPLARESNALLSVTLSSASSQAKTLHTHNVLWAVLHPLTLTD